jgi:hypothetical protein
MSMTKVTNRAPGPRGFNVLNEAGEFHQVVLQPGETRELDLGGAAHPVLAGMVRKGDIVFGQEATKANADADEMEALIAKQNKEAEAEASDQEKREKVADLIEKDAKVQQAERNAEHRGRGRPPKVVAPVDFSEPVPLV